MSKEINLDELIYKHCYICIDGSDGIHTAKSDVKNLILEFAGKILELASENADMIAQDPGFSLSTCECPDWTINKQSILDTINQIEL